jgi:hypothetical protein
MGFAQPRARARKAARGLAPKSVLAAVSGEKRETFQIGGRTTRIIETPQTCRLWLLVFREFGSVH